MVPRPALGVGRHCVDSYRERELAAHFFVKVSELADEADAIQSCDQQQQKEKHSRYDYADYMETRFYLLESLCPPSS